MRKITLCLMICVTLSQGLYGQAEKSVLKAERNIERGNLKAAKEDYLAALKSEPDSRIAHLGLGLMLSELLDNYAEALPHLEKAYQPSVQDSSYDLIFALAKCYHYNSEFDKALEFYNRLEGVQDLEEEKDFQREIKKRKSDCEYAKKNSPTPPDAGIYIANAGKQINTDMPEYVPVLAKNNELIFTSKRKDDKNEQLNYLDGKYFEGMYVVNIQPYGFNNFKRYKLPEKLMSSKVYNHHQAVVSISPDGKKLFTFQDSKLYEINLEDEKYQEPGEVKIKKFDHYQNHAFLTKDGKTLYFTSDVAGGLGGTDIYKSEKDNTGGWGKPVNLGEPINTPFDEDAPYISNDGTFYFASEGHEGYGNYDIYKSSNSDGKWSAPQNLGRPINSPGHDIFLVIDSTQTAGYFSSGRNGGFGDMDIYKISYLDKMKKDCPEQPLEAITLTIADVDTSDYSNRVNITAPFNYKILSSEWQIEGASAGKDSRSLDYDYKQQGTYKVSAKIIAGCDTCIMPMITCRTIDNKIEKIAPSTPVVAMEGGMPASSTSVAALNNTKKEKETEKDKTKDEVGSGTNVGVDGVPPNNPDKQKNNDAVAEKDNTKKNSTPSAEKYIGELSENQLASIGFNSNHILFDFNKTTLRADAYEILNNNIKVLKAHPELYIQVNGYADSRGPKAVNERISALRARAVKSYLMSKGTRSSQIRFVNGKGSDKLLNDCGPDSNCPEEEHQKNRRVEFVVTGESK